MRVDAYEKVTGKALYGADRVLPNMAYAALALAKIGRGTVSDVDTSAALAVPGVLLVETRFELASPGFIMGGQFGFQSLQPMTGDHIAYRGQPIAIVVAETPVAATEAAEAITATYQEEPFALHLDSEGATTLVQEEAIPLPFLADIKLGDADAVIDSSAVQIDATYVHPPQHAVPMELNGGVVEWQGGTLIVHEGTQNANAVRFGLAQQLGIDAAKIEVRSPYVGGGFGQKNSLLVHIGPLALVSQRLGRPVKLVLTRTQTFHNGSFRPVSKQRIRLGADESGKINAVVHEVDQQTSRHDLFIAMHNETSSRLYGYSAFRGRQRLVQTDVQTPGYMRAPFESPSMFAIEQAVDELAYRVGRDPVELRLANDTENDPITGLPFSSRHIGDCLRRGAELFGWSERSPEPRSMRAEDGSLVGWGVAIGNYPASIVAAHASLAAGEDGKVTVAVDGHEMGQGIRSTIALLVARDLGIPVGDVIVRVGDTRYGPQHLTAGSWGTASALPAVHSGLQELRKLLNVAGTGDVDVAAAVADIGHAVEVSAHGLGPGQSADALGQTETGHMAIAGPVFPGFVTFSWIAHFVEVHVEPTTCRVRVPRVVSVADCGRVASPVTAASQVRGGVIWGIGAALREESLVDDRFGGFLNSTLEEYPVMVNADVGSIDVDFVDKPDYQFNPVGVKGLGEVSMVGAAAAVANAVHHATGRRHHRLPIRIEHII
ncbi:xanthine dehydrogenase family protein molybdopterin-binding subunit [Kutzneria chonburiensis]|uniref:Xanthine dehydrogenase family protein molybdopterin-binding subunit n=1 Tax=Kutzneria chonburiensis TaxID=1483604 RepID=A0ABV6N8S5_9PSEU|nr:xanthine dehydrogenase family protein molybdopterin-binding subunit [Kutzneria chonburiensis]